MFFSSWLRKHNAKPRTSRRASSTFRPRLEALEGRDVPSNNTLTVTNLYDGGPGSLRYEISQVSSKDDTIVFDKKLAGIITLSSELVISKSVTIKGNSKVTIESQTWVDNLFDSHRGSRILEVDGAGTAVALSGLTMTGGGGTRLGNGNFGDPNDGYGGAILNFGTLSISGCTLGGNTLVGLSGLYGNSAETGGAIANFGTMSVSGCDVSNNSAIGLPGAPISEGGGIYNAGTAAELTVANSYFSNNYPDNIFGPYTDGGGNAFH